jgi:nicotinamidase/pyrazinamidase
MKEFLFIIYFNISVDNTLSIIYTGLNILSVCITITMKKGRELMKSPEKFNNVVAIGVDMEVDFCPGGALAVDEGDQVVAPFNDVARWTRDQNGKVVFTRDWHPHKTTHFDKWPVHCVRNTPGALFHPDLEVLEFEENDIIISKGIGAEDDAYSGFDGVTSEGKKLEYILSDEVAQGKPLAVLIGGLATDYCVKETVVDACRLSDKLSWTHLNIGVFVIRDAIRAVNLAPTDGEEAIETMEKAGATLVDSKDLIAGKVLEIGV